MTRQENDLMDKIFQLAIALRVDRQELENAVDELKIAVYNDAYAAGAKWAESPTADFEAFKRGFRHAVNNFALQAEQWLNDGTKK